MLAALFASNLFVLFLLGAAVLRIQHLNGQISELTALVGDEVANQYLLNEVRQELAETKMQLEISRAGK